MAYKKVGGLLSLILQLSRLVSNSHNHLQKRAYQSLSAEGASNCQISAYIEPLSLDEQPHPDPEAPYLHVDPTLPHPSMSLKV